MKYSFYLKSHMQSQQSQGVTPRRKKRKLKKGKEEISLLQLNIDLYKLEVQKVEYRKEKLELQRELIGVMKTISHTLDKMVPHSVPIDFNILNQIQAEQ